MMGKPMKTLELHYPMIQFLIISYIRKNVRMPGVVLFHAYMLISKCQRLNLYPTQTEEGTFEALTNYGDSFLL